MAPLASEPRQVLTVLNPAQRKALYMLTVEITAHMRSQLEFHEPAGNSQLLIDPSAENSIIVPTAGGDTAPPNPALVRLRAAALQHFDAWRKDVLTKFKDLLSAPDDANIVDQRRRRAERIAQLQSERTSASSSSSSPSSSEARENETRATAVARLQAHWRPIPTRLVTIPYENRAESLSCLLLVLLSTGRYSADARALAVYLASSLELPLDVLNAEEMEIARSLVEGSARAAAEQQQTSMSAEVEAEKRKQQNQASRYWKVGLASVAGAAIIGVTGGLAAPVIAGAIGGLMGSVGLGGVASFLGIFWMNGALVGTLFGAMGARMTGEMVDRYAREVEDFRFIRLKDKRGTNGGSQDDRRLRVTIGINGWLDSKEDVTRPWRALGTDSEAFALRYEVKSLLGLGKSLKELLSSYAWNTVKVELLKRTVLATLWSALWPAHLLSMASAIDNPFSLAKNRSEKAGEILADALINKVQGERPVTLVGYSLGARVIYSCLRSLATRRAFGLIDTVVLIGAPVPSNTQHWQMMRTVVSGKIFNVYSDNDYLLAFLYRATSIQLGVAGLQEINDVQGLENLNLSDAVQGHMRYAKIIPQILARCNIPVVQGPEAPIADDEDIIGLDDLDRDNNQVGNLVDLDGLIVPEQPRQSEPPPLLYSPTPVMQPLNAAPRNQPESSLSTQPGGTHQIQQTTVTRASPSAPSTNQDSVGPSLIDIPMPRPRSNPAPAQPAPLAASQFRAWPSPEPSPSRSLPANNAPLYAPPTASAAPAPVPEPLSRTPVSQVSVTQAPTSPVFPFSHDHGSTYKREDDDSDEDGGGGIKLVDNDDGLAYKDPTPIED
ncbi:hypothetical protein VTK26DRAFT_2214 [Humicola hyalothermophila]